MNQKRIFLLHGWEGNTKNHWFPWLKRELESRGFMVIIPEFPGEKYPILSTWLRELARSVGAVDADTYFVGHSLGCITILKYLETLPKVSHVGGVYLVAGFINSLGIPEIENFVEEPLITGRVQSVCSRVVAFQSTNDDYVAMSEGDAIEEQLRAKLVIIPNAGHFCADDGYETFPQLLEALLLP